MPCALPEGRKGSRSVAPAVLGVGTRWINYTVRPLYPRERIPVPIEYAIGWAQIGDRSGRKLSYCCRDSNPGLSWVEGNIKCGLEKYRPCVRR